MSSDTHLKKLFDSWGKKANAEYADKQWLLSKWEVQDGIEWPREKTENLVKSLCAGLDPQKEDALIELGCGGGWLLKELKPFVAETYGLDFSPYMLRFAYELFEGKNLMCAEIGKLPLKDAQFEKIFSYYVFMNFADDAYVEAALKEIVRILKPNGRALIGQLPDIEGSSKYEAAKAGYYGEYASQGQMGNSIREEFKPPLRLFDRAVLSKVLEDEPVRVSFQDSFNPFYTGENAPLIDWRFDLIIEKVDS